jgi:hypothetical protein
MESNWRPFSFNFVFGNKKKSQGVKSGECGRWGDVSRYVFHQKVLGEDWGVRRGVVMLKQPGLFSPEFWATSLHFFTLPPQNVAVEPEIHSLAYWERCFALPQLMYIWWHQSGIFWIPPRTTWRPIHICDLISLNSSQNEKCFRWNFRKKIKTHARHSVTAPPPKILAFLGQ